MHQISIDVAGYDEPVTGKGETLELAEKDLFEKIRAIGVRRVMKYGFMMLASEAEKIPQLPEGFGLVLIDSIDTGHRPNSAFYFAVPKGETCTMQGKSGLAGDDAVCFTFFDFNTYHPEHFLDLPKGSLKLVKGAWVLWEKVW